MAVEVEQRRLEREEPWIVEWARHVTAKDVAFNAPFLFRLRSPSTWLCYHVILTETRHPKREALNALSRQERVPRKLSDVRKENTANFLPG